jgi:hypothetical protein
MFGSSVNWGLSEFFKYYPNYEINYIYIYIERAINEGYQCNNKMDLDGLLVYEGKYNNLNQFLKIIKYFVIIEYEDKKYPTSNNNFPTFYKQLVL